MKHRLVQMLLWMTVMLMSVLVFYGLSFRVDVQAVGKPTIEIIDCAASYQWTRLTGQLSSTRLVDGIGFCYYLSGDLLTVVTERDVDPVTASYSETFSLDLSGDDVYVARAYYIQYHLDLMASITGRAADDCLTTDPKVQTSARTITKQSSVSRAIVAASAVASIARLLTFTMHLLFMLFLIHAPCVSSDIMKLIRQQQER